MSDGQPIIMSGQAVNADAHAELEPMTERRTRTDLRGVWAAVATTLDEAGRFAEGPFRENIRRLHAAGVHGIYTTDADGEFYAIELDEFRTIIDVFADETQRLGFPSQVGVTWSSTEGVVARLQIAANAGVQGAHVAHPYFMPLNRPSFEAFWQDVARAVPDDFALIHYNSARASNVLTGEDYVELGDRFPNFIGSKQPTTEFETFARITAQTPLLSHFTSEATLTPFAQFGARGVYSWFVNFNQTYMLDWYSAIALEDWPEAIRRQHQMNEFIRAMDIFHRDGHLHGVVGKAVAAASNFLVPSLVTRRPYLSISPAAVNTFRELVTKQFPEMVWTP